MTPAQSGPSTTPGVDDFWRSSDAPPEPTFPNPPKSIPEQPTSVVDGFVQRFETGMALGLFDESGKLEEVVYLAGTVRGWYRVDFQPQR